MSIHENETTTFLNITPYLRYPDGDAAVEWLSRVLGFGPAEAARDDAGNWYEGTIAVGAANVNIGGGAASPSGGYLIIGVPDADAVFDRIRAAGVAVDPPVDKSYGPRSVSITDPWGTTWDFWQGEATI